MSTTAETGNPGVVGLAGFGLTTMLLQFHNLGWCGLGPVVALGFIFGGAAQLIAGFQEFKGANNFGYSAFVSYGAFWISLGIIFMLNFFNIYKSDTKDVGWFLVGWTLYTFVMWIASLKVHAAMSTTFTLLLAGFILLDFAHFGYPSMTPVAGYVLIGCALSAWYMMAHTIFLQVFGWDVLPLGKPWHLDQSKKGLLPPDYYAEKRFLIESVK